MPVTKRRKTNGKAGSRSNSRATTPVPTSRSSSPLPPGALLNATDAPAESNLNPPLVLTSAKPRGTVECDFCGNDISRLPRIRCAVCPDFDLCVDCFATTDPSATIARLRATAEARTKFDDISAGGLKVQHQGKQAPLGSPAGTGDPSAAVVSTAWHTGTGAINHNETHGYRVCDNTRYPMFPNSSKVKIEEKSSNKDDDEDAMDVDDGEEETLSLIPDDPKAIWTVEEDLRLLDAIETHGLGNWVDIAEAISGHGSTGKTPRRCMERYFDDYLGRYGHILPPYTLVEDTAEDKEVGDGASSNAGDEGAASEGGVSNSGSVAKDLDPTRLSKRRHAVMVRTTASGSNQPYHRFSKKLKAVRTESLPEYQDVLKAFPPKVPEKYPVVKEGDKVYRDEAAKQEQQFVKQISTVSSEEEKKIREEWKETKYMKPGGPTVLPARPEDVVKLPGAELAGFMPRRGDFDIEWANDAEKALADMEFLPGDLPEDKKLKLQVLQIYNERLDEREKRKNFILSRNLHDYRKNQEEEAKLPRDERDLVRRMRLFERFHSPEEHKQFLDDILKAKRLRKEIAKFQMYRRIGITTVLEAEQYELDKNRRNFHRLAVLQKENSSKQKTDKTPGAGAASVDSAAAQNAAGKKDDRNAEVSLWKEYKNPISRRRSSSGRSQDGGGAASESGNTPKDKDAKPEESALGDKDAKPKEDAKTGEPTDDTNPKVEKITDAKDAKADEPTPEDQDAKPKEAKDNEDALEVDQSDTKKAADDVGEEKPEETDPKTDNEGKRIEQMEGFQFLSDKEVDLCRRIEFTPKEYLEVKKVLIEESLKNGMLDKDGSKRTIVKIDVEKRGDIVDFMVHAGWISSKMSSKVARSVSE